MKLEIGSGLRPTEGYLHQDVIQLESHLDFVCNAWQIPVEDESLSEVIAIAVMEHLRYDDFHRTLKHIYRILKKGGEFYFDVPDLFVWNNYLYDILHNKPCDYSKQDVIKTMWGWQRWIGDEHKSMWTKDGVYEACRLSGFTVSDGLEDIKKRVHRDRFYIPANAHIYIKAVK